MTFVFSRFQAVPKIFSSGLDITEMCGKSTEHYAEFWRAVQEMWLRLYGSNMVTVAAVNVRPLDPPSSSPRAVCHLLWLVCSAWAGTAEKIRLVSTETSTGMYLLGCLGKVHVCQFSALGCGKVWKRGMLQGPCKLQALLGYSSISAAVESLHGTRVLLMGAEVPFVQ